MPLVRCLRVFSFKGTSYQIGSEIDVPAPTAERHSKTSPPRLEIISESELDELTAPVKPKKPAKKKATPKAKGKADEATDA